MRSNEGNYAARNRLQVRLAPKNRRYARWEMDFIMKTLALLITITGLQRSAEAQPAGHIQSLSHAIHAVNDLDTTLAFYRDVFGLSGNPEFSTNPRGPAADHRCPA